MTTFEALVGFTADQTHQSIVAFTNTSFRHLPLAHCTVTLDEGSVFMVAGREETGYFDDLEDALWFARRNGVELKPGAITILEPAMAVKGIPSWNVYQVHECAAVKAQEAK
jgi:hypothetical protein